MDDYRSGDRVRDETGRTGTVVDITAVADTDDPGAATRMAVLVRLDGSGEVVGYLADELTAAGES